VFVSADYLTGLTNEVSGEECNVAGAAANIEYVHAGADSRLLKELSRDWLDEAALYSQTLKLVIRVTERVDWIIHSRPPTQDQTMPLSQRCGPCAQEA